MNWKNIFKRTIPPKSVSAKEIADSLLKYTNKIYQKNIKDIKKILHKENMAEGKKIWCEW